MTGATKPGTPVELSRPLLAAHIGNGSTLLDLRDAVPFGEAHVERSVHIKAKSPDFLDRVLRFTPQGRDVVLVSDGIEDAAWAAAELTGHRPVAGWASHRAMADCGAAALGRLDALTPSQLHQRLSDGMVVHVLDVREPSEWKEGLIPGAARIPMYEVLESLERLPRDKPIAIVCAGGQRSSLIGSQLLARGFTDLLNVTGGMKAWNAAGLPVEPDE